MVNVPLYSITSYGMLYCNVLLCCNISYSSEYLARRLRPCTAPNTDVRAPFAHLSNRANHAHRPRTLTSRLTIVILMIIVIVILTRIINNSDHSSNSLLCPAPRRQLAVHVAAHVGVPRGAFSEGRSLPVVSSLLLLYWLSLTISIKYD